MEDCLITLGLNQVEKETGYGYIQFSEEMMIV